MSHPSGARGGWRCDARPPGVTAVTRRTRCGSRTMTLFSGRAVTFETRWAPGFRAALAFLFFHAAARHGGRGPTRRCRRPRRGGGARRRLRLLAGRRPGGPPAAAILPVPSAIPLRPSHRHPQLRPPPTHPPGPRMLQRRPCSMPAPSPAGDARAGAGRDTPEKDMLAGVTRRGIHPRGGVRGGGAVQLGYTPTLRPHPPTPRVRIGPLFAFFDTPPPGS